MSQANYIYICKNCSKEYSTENQTNFKSNQFCCKECFEEYNKTSIIKQRTYYCEYCGIEFIPVTKKKSIRFCCPGHSAKYVHLSKEEQISRTKKYRKPYICLRCGKKVTSDNWYGSGMFCCEKCSRSYSSKYANTEEKRKEKSDTLKNKEATLKYCIRCGCNILSRAATNNVVCDKCKYIFSKNPKKEKYYSECEFKFSDELYSKILGYKLLKTYGIYNTFTNRSGVSRDHRVSIIYGFNNNINPNLISHPANCEIITQSNNSSKREKCSITVEELKEQIKEWDIKYGIYNKEIYENHLLE